MRERLHKVIAARGVASRRRAEQLILAGEVLVNGHVAHVGDLVDQERDTILVSGQTMSAAPDFAYIALNKPVGYISAASSPRGEPVVTDLVATPYTLVPVGRLDKDTSGLLLLTNDGEWLNGITHPRYMVEKEYLVRVAGTPTSHELQRLREGVFLPDGTRTSAASVTLADARSPASLVKVIVTEGKKRQIRLMFHAVNHPVLGLRRVRIGHVTVAGIPEGEWRHLRSEEVEAFVGSERDRTAARGAHHLPAHRR
ncbi:MAG: pseudouridine synthase [Chloroflexota bacterium]